METSTNLADWDLFPVGEVTTSATIDNTIPTDAPARSARLKVTRQRRPAPPTPGRRRRSNETWRWSRTFHA